MSRSIIILGFTRCSSKITRLLLTMITENGIIAAMHVHVGSTNPIKAEAVRRVFARLFGEKDLEIRLIRVSSGVPAQPFDAQVAQGARMRAEKALCEADYGVGIEAGLIWNETFQGYFDVQFCVIVDQGGHITTGHGSGFFYPPSVIARVQQGQTVGQAMTALTGIEKIGQKMGAIGYLTQGLLDRTTLTEQAVLMALVPRIRDELYKKPNGG
jgi:inosine/xanthosine triphosphatase